jgi:RNA polymerase sigma factor (sigma-70 family)
MPQRDTLAEHFFEEHRGRLRAIAYRMLGSTGEADDAVQEAWLRLNRSSASTVDNLGGWLTTTVGHICLDILRTRKSRREETLDDLPPLPAESYDPEHEAVLAESVGLALLIVLDTLAPPERMAFVLHDMFALSFEEIAPILGRSTDATRQLASRARRRVRGAQEPVTPDDQRQRIIEAFLAAARAGDFQGLLSVLDPDVVVRSDGVGIATGSPGEVHGAAVVAAQFMGRAQAAHVALVDGELGIVVIIGGEPKLAVRVSFAGSRIASLDGIGDLAHLALMQLTPFD